MNLESYVTEHTERTESNGKAPEPPEVAGGFTQGFLATLSVVLVSELGDKTFFIAAIMAMKNPRVLIFTGAMLALISMTGISAAFGWVVTYIPRKYTYYGSAVIFALFGIKMLYDGIKMKRNEARNELNEVQIELTRRDREDGTDVSREDEEREPTASPTEPDRTSDSGESRRKLKRPVFKILLQAASLTFLAEWGDRSQLATVILSSRENVYGVVLGSIIGHSMCTGLAVLGGRMIAQRISVKTVTLIGGIVFLVFAVSALFIDPGT